VPVVGGVNVFGNDRPCSELLLLLILLLLRLFILLLLLFGFDDVDVILQTDTAFLRYFRSRLVVPLVMPTS